MLFSEPAYFLEQPGEIFATWNGGMGIIGSLIGGLLVAVWFCRKHSIPLLRFGDTLAPGMALGQTTGQLACLLKATATADQPIFPGRLLSPIRVQWLP